MNAGGPIVDGPIVGAPAIRFDRVSIVFGDAPETALPLMDKGLSREEIRENTGQVLGVHDCTLDVGEGEIVVLMGLSGSGKSTLLRAVNGLAPVVRGRCLVRGDAEWTDPAACSPQDLRRLRGGRIAMVFQSFALLPWRTVADNVGLGLELAGVPKQERARRVMAQLELVGLEGWEHCRVEELSGGMRQRVGLARAFATEAPVLLMDEPFSALDPLIRSRLQDELLEFQRRLRKTIVFVSHDLEEAVKLGGRIAIMQGGRIVQSGTPQEIVLRPKPGYVSDFVAHINPLAVLCARDLARPLSEPGPPAMAGPDTPVARLLELRAELGAERGLPIGPTPGGPADFIVDDAAILDALARKPSG